ncbi:GTPase HflX [Eubacterium oxidoreducens]|nr:GTPase HflX [Eubacterium oxidoreducens]
MTEQMQTITERLVLVGVSMKDGDDTQDSMKELELLCKTAGAEVVCSIIQNRENIHPGTYVGKGKIEEIRESLLFYHADGIVCDDELSPAQMKNLEDELDCKVMDRTLVILDIFAARARTSEGKLQVELAQLKYSMTRLAGFGKSMSRLGGGIGTRGPGETKLEVDRRVIKNRVAQLSRELKEMQQHREVARSAREHSHLPVIAIVGYTNAGKSTLLNYLTDAGVLQEDKLFATLDATTRKLSLPNKQEVLLTDTVGFIRKLPHHLIEAFKSTLEEAKYADILIHVIDASNPQRDKQMHIVYETLDRLGVKDKPIITLFNKQDLVKDEEALRDFRAEKAIKTTILKGQGIDTLFETIEQLLREDKQYIEHVFSYDEGSKVAQIRKNGELLEEEYVAEGILIKAYVSQALAGQLGICD